MSSREKIQLFWDITPLRVVKGYRRLKNRIASIFGSKQSKQTWIFSNYRRPRIVRIASGPAEFEPVTSRMYIEPLPTH